MQVTKIHLQGWAGEIPAPLRLVESIVKAEWVDDYRHLNMAHYLTICDQANWAFWDWLNAPERTIGMRSGHECVMVENHVVYLRELMEGARFSIETQVTDFDEKRYILFHRVLNAEGNLAATNEVKCLAFNLESRRPEGWRQAVQDRLGLIHDVHLQLGRPAQLSQSIALKKR